jgi:Methyltransferase domain
MTNRFTVSRTGETGVLWLRFQSQKENSGFIPKSLGGWSDHRGGPMIAKSGIRLAYSNLVPLIPALLNPGVGPRANFFIRADYNSRIDNEGFDDRFLKGEWQRKVYRFADKIACERGVHTVCDFGCGSGYKLMQHFKSRRTVGIEIPPALDHLRTTYPDRQWMHSDFSAVPEFPIDLFIASDVIEHLSNPDLLIQYIRKVNPRLIVLSTPDRIINGWGHYAGPPGNLAHVREWTFREFQAYISGSFTIERHFISDYRQNNQCVLCHPLRKLVLSPLN